MELATRIRQLLNDPIKFSSDGSGIRLRSYQIEAARAIIESVKHNLGLSFVVMFPRQSGKNELQAQIETFIMAVLARSGAEIVKVSPTWKPQAINAMRRLETNLKRNKITALIGWKREQGYIYACGDARVTFLSGQERTNIVGATASTLLEVDEAQDINITKFDKDIAPMAASTNATRVFYGTAWTTRTLLAREIEACRRLEAATGKQLVFIVNCERVSLEVEEYKNYVADQIEKLGRNHPLIKTQYYCETIDEDASLFNAERLAMMNGSHELLEIPQPGRTYAITIDIAGEDESIIDNSQLESRKQNNTALTIFEINYQIEKDEIRNIYHVVNRHVWNGVKHSRLFSKIKALIDHWSAGFVIVDATGMGAGITSFLQARYGERIIPFIFTGASKSKLAWDFIAAIEGGRWKDHKKGDPTYSRLVGKYGYAGQEIFYEELSYCRSEIQTGPGHLIRWGVPDGTRNTEGNLVNDDTIISASMIVVLDELSIGIAESGIIKQDDLMLGMSEVF